MKAITTNDEKQSVDDETNHELPLWTTTRNELWAYYLYYVGNNGLSAFNFGPSQFQNLLFLAGYDPTEAPFSVPCGDNGCVLPYLGAVRDSMSCMSICMLLTENDEISQLTPSSYSQMESVSRSKQLCC